MSERGRLLGIDHGAKFVGIALSDATQLIARPLQVLARSTRERDFGAIMAVIEEHQIVGVVVGLPNVPEGFTGVSQAETVGNWAVRLAGQIKPVPVYAWDETLSTDEAQRLAAESGSKRAQGGRIDDWAAAVILQTFLDAHPPGTAYPPPVAGRKRNAPKGQNVEPTS